MKVSVLTPLYKTNPEYLREMIESILNQTFSDFEFILLNDSPENKELKKIIESYKDSRIIYLENDTNIGISDSRNKLLSLSKGEYVAIFDHDDISNRDRLKKQVQVLDEHQEIGVVGCFTKWIPCGRIIKYPVNNLEIKFSLMNWCAIPHSGAMIRKSVLEKNRILWEEEFSPAEDYMLWIRLLGKTMFYNIPEVLLYYRMYDTNTTNLKKNVMMDKDAIIKCIAQKEYPFFKISISNSATYKKWLLLFGFIPFIKIKLKEDKLNFYLFGLVKLFSLGTFYKLPVFKIKK